jgi:hypothetical protein
MGYSSGSSRRWSEIPDQEFYSIRQDDLSRGELAEYQDERARRAALAPGSAPSAGLSRLTGSLLAVALFLGFGISSDLGLTWLAILCWASCIALTVKIASDTERSVGAWGVAAFFGGPIAMLIAAVTSPRKSALGGLS